MTTTVIVDMGVELSFIWHAATRAVLSMSTGTPLRPPIGLLLLDEAKEYAMPTQTFRSEFPFKSGSHRVDTRESLSHPMPMPAPAGATAPSSPYQGTSWS